MRKATIHGDGGTLRLSVAWKGLRLIRVTVTPVGGELAGMDLSRAQAVRVANALLKWAGEKR